MINTCLRSRLAYSNFKLSINYLVTILVKLKPDCCAGGYRNPTGKKCFLWPGAFTDFIVSSVPKTSHPSRSIKVSTRSIMVSLPPEIISMICDVLDTINVPAFRLVCRARSQIGSEYLIPGLSFQLQPDSLARLEAISLHPIFRGYVRSIISVRNRSAVS